MKIKISTKLLIDIWRAHTPFLLFSKSYPILEFTLVKIVGDKITFFSSRLSTSVQTSINKSECNIEEADKSEFCLNISSIGQYVKTLEEQVISIEINGKVSTIKHSLGNCDFDMEEPKEFPEPNIEEVTSSCVISKKELVLAIGNSLKISSRGGDFILDNAFSLFLLQGGVCVSGAGSAGFKRIYYGEVLGMKTSEDIAINHKDLSVIKDSLAGDYVTVMTSKLSVIFEFNKTTIIASRSTMAPPPVRDVILSAAQRDCFSVSQKRLRPILTRIGRVVDLDGVNSSKPVIIRVIDGLISMSMEGVKGSLEFLEAELYSKEFEFKVAFDDLTKAASLLNFEDLLVKDTERVVIFESNGNMLISSKCF